MGFYDERRKALGIGGNKTGLSFYARRRIDLGLAPPTFSYDPAKQNIDPTKELTKSRADMLQSFDKFVPQQEIDRVALSRPSQNQQPPAQAELRGPIDSVPLTKKQEKEANKIYSTLGPRSPLERGVGMLSEGVMEATNSATLGIPGAIERKMLGDNGFYGRPEDERTWAGKAGEIAGEFMPLSKAYAVTKPLISVFKGAATRNLAHDVMAGLAFQGAKELADSGLDTRNDGSQSLGQRALNVGESAALFAAGGALFRGVGRELKTHNPDLVEPQLKDPVSKLTSVRALNKAGALATDKTVKSLLPEQLGALSPNTVTENAVKQGEHNVIPFTQPTMKERLKDAASGLGGDESLGINAFAKHEDYGYKNPKDTRSHIVTKTNGEKLGFTERVRRFYEKSNDNLQRINQFDKYVEQTTGQKLSPSDRSYMLALNQRGADMISHSILTENLVNARGEAIGQSLKDITKHIPKRRMVDFEDYLIAKHAETRMAPERGERVYSAKSEMTLDKVKQKITDYESRYPEYQKIAEQMYDFSNKLGEAWLVDTGIISRETWQQWRDENPFWIPMKRDFKDIELKSGGQAKRAFANQNAPVKAYSETGSERKIVSPIESMIEYVDSFVKTAKRNEVMQTVIRNLEKDSAAFKDFAEIVPGQADDMAAMLRGEDGIENVLNIVNEGFEKAMKKPDLTKGNVVSALIGGKRQFVKVNDPAFLEALTNLSPQAQSKIIEWSGKATNIMKVLTTGINPVFSLTRNIFYDIPQAFAFSKTTNNPIRFAWDLLDGIISTFRNKELYRAYKAMGGGHSSSVAADRNLLAQSKLKIMPQREKFSLIRKAYAGLENLANVIESAPRLGEFKRITKAGGNSYDSRVKGLFEAQDVTTNFKRYGSVAKQADAIFPYLNAAIQGLDKFARAFKDNPVQVATKAFIAVTIPTVALFAINYNNPKYQKLSNYTKDRFFLIPTTSEKHPFIKIPKPRELGIPFGAAVERSLRLMAESDPEAFRGFADQVRIAFAPPGISAGVEDLQRGKIPNPFKDTIAGPLFELDANQNFAGAPIVPGYLQDLSPRYQYDANTSEVAKKVGNVLNVSPKQIDHLIRSYGGVIGQLGIPANTQGTTLKDTLVQQVTADPTFSTDASNFFYTLKDKLDTQYKDYKATGVVPAGYNDAARVYLNNVASAMGDITKALREVDKSDLSRDEKAKQKRELTEARNELARESYRRVVEALQ